MATDTTPIQAQDQAPAIALNLRRTFKAPRERVFRAWTDPEKLAKWWGPETRTCPFAELDARPGGRWRTCMRDENGDEAWVQGVYREVEPPARLVFTWAWENDGVPGHETLVTIEFHDRGDETEMVFTHEGFETEEGRDLHNQGWTSSLVCLEQCLSEGD
jgi:uncharacterized protein YndB with AHSA1/START domain